MITPTLRLFIAVSTLTLIALLLITAGAGYRLEMGPGRLIFAPPEPDQAQSALRSSPSKPGANDKDASQPELEASR